MPNEIADFTAEEFRDACKEASGNNGTHYTQETPQDSTQRFSCSWQVTTPSGNQRRAYGYGSTRREAFQMAKDSEEWLPSLDTIAGVAGDLV